MNAIDQLQRELNKTELHAEALGFLRSLLSDLGTDEMPGDGSYTYYDQKGRAERFMLSGNGPTAYAVFVEFTDGSLTGFIEYSASGGTTIVKIPDGVERRLLMALRIDARTRNAR